MGIMLPAQLGSLFLDFKMHILGEMCFVHASQPDLWDE